MSSCSGRPIRRQLPHWSLWLTDALARNVMEFHYPSRRDDVSHSLSLSRSLQALPPHPDWDGLRENSKLVGLAHTLTFYLAPCVRKMPIWTHDRETHRTGPNACGIYWRDNKTSNGPPETWRPAKNSTFSRSYSKFAIDLKPLCNTLTSLCGFMSTWIQTFSMLQKIFRTVTSMLIFRHQMLTFILNVKRHTLK